MMQRIGLLLAVCIFGLDQISKPWILSVFDGGARFVEVTPFFNLVLVYNRGVSFGLLSNNAEHGPYILAGLAVAIALAIYYFLLCKTEKRIMAIACGLIIGGAFGNALDRLLYGAVVDFLDFHVAGYHWPSFNVADCAIVVGAFLIAYDGLFGAAKQPK
ncbi:MAG: signal peptidase II [Alphaproteobacteria bacterium]|nr:signal peptidase II [Alphaproteobacteria bacterium]